MLSTAPSLMSSIPSPDVSYFQIPVFGWFTLTIHFYALFIIAGIVIATIMANRTLTRRGGESGIILDILLVTVPISIICARLFHVFTHASYYFAPGHAWWDITQRDSIWAIWDGGIAIYGALIGGAIGAWLGCKWTGIRFWSFADAIAPGMLLAQALGRLGNYVNKELFGLPTDLPWGLEIPADNPAFPTGLPEGTLFHPTFLYEIIWNVLGVIVLLWLQRKVSMRWGRLFAVYLIWYSAGRVVWESIRIDPSDIILGLRTNVWSAILGIVVGIVILIVQRRHLGVEPSVYVDGRGPKNAVRSNVTTDDYVDVSAPPAALAADTAPATSSTGTAASAAH